MFFINAKRYFKTSLLISLTALVLEQKDNEIMRLVLLMLVIYSVISTTVIGSQSHWYQYSVLPRTDWTFYGDGYLLAGCLLMLAAHTVARIRPAG